MPEHLIRLPPELHAPPDAHAFCCLRNSQHSVSRRPAHPLSTVLCVLSFSVVTLAGSSSAFECLSLLSWLNSIDISLPSFLCAYSACTPFTIYFTLGRRAIDSRAAETAGCRFPSDSAGSCAKAAPPLPARRDVTSPRTCPVF